MLHNKIVTSNVKITFRIVTRGHTNRRDELVGSTLLFFVVVRSQTDFSRFAECRNDTPIIRLIAAKADNSVMY